MSSGSQDIGTASSYLLINSIFSILKSEYPRKQTQMANSNCELCVLNKTPILFKFITITTSYRFGTGDALLFEEVLPQKILKKENGKIGGIRNDN